MKSLIVLVYDTQQERLI